jgi:uncharacterized membrane protein YhaH (DUF805 family)
VGFGGFSKTKKGRSMNWYLKVLKNYAGFSGRAQRAEYWYFALFSFIIYVGLVIIDVVTGNFSEEFGIGMFTGIYSLAVMIPSLAVMVRRLHDTDHSAWWLLIGLIPLVGGIVLFIFSVLDSKPAENQYGANPKALSV